MLYLKHIKKLFLFLFAFVSSMQLLASHSASMDITYKCLGNNQYEVTITQVLSCETYVDENGDAQFSIPGREYFTLTIESASLSEVFTERIDSVSGEVAIDITPACLGKNSKCSDTTSFLDGYDLYVYRGIITLPAQADDWHLTVCDHSRNFGITTLDATVTDPAATCISALVNNTASVGCNNSPVFGNLPLGIVCAGTELCFNHAAFDIDGDRLVYEIVEPQDHIDYNIGVYMQENTLSELVDVPWIASCPMGGSPSGAKPFCSDDSIVIDSITGNFCISPTMVETSVMAVKVSEYRNDVLVGSVVRDIQIKGFACANNPPTINDVAANLRESCGGTPFSFDIETDDIDGDPIQMSFLNLPQGASVNVVDQNTPDAYAQFNWTPSSETLDSFACFTVNVTDNDSACDYYNTSSKTFCLKIMRVDAVVDTLTCWQDADGSIALDPFGGSGSYTYNWSNGATSSSISSISTGTYTVTVSDASFGCNTIEQYTISPIPFRDSVVSCGAGSIFILPDQQSFNNSSIGNWQQGTVDNADFVLTSTRANLSNTTAGLNFTAILESPCIDFTNYNYPNIELTYAMWHGANNLASMTLQAEVPFNSGNWIDVAIDNTGQGASPETRIYDLSFYSQGLGRLRIVGNIQNNDGSSNYVQILSAKIDAAPVSPSNVQYNSPSSFGLGFDDFSDTTVFSSTSTGIWIQSTLDSSDFSWGGSQGFRIQGSSSIQGRNLACIETPYLDYAAHLNPELYLEYSLFNFSSPTVDTAKIFVMIEDPVASANYIEIWQDATAPSTSTLRQTTIDLSPYINKSLEKIKVCALVNHSSASSFTRAALFEVQLNADENTPIETTAFINDVLCADSADGSILLQTSGGFAPYSFNWSNGSTLDSIYDLSAQDYYLTVTDAQACQHKDTFTVSEPLPISITATITDITCTASGSVSITASNGTAPYTYAWSNGSTTNSMTTAIAGNFTLTITDANGCQKDTVFTINDLSNFDITPDTTNITCADAMDGALSVTALGGTPPYSYAWSSGETTNSVSSKDTGFYTVTVSDNAGCTKEHEFYLADPRISIIANPLVDVSCQGVNDGYIVLQASGLNGGLTYLWSTGAATDSIGGLDTGTYSVTVTDAGACQDSASFTLIYSTTYNYALALGIVDVSCNGFTDGSITANVSGGTPVYSYLWSNAATSGQISGLDSGMYYVTITDDIGCELYDSAFVGMPSSLDTSSTTVNHPQCADSLSGTVEVVATGGTPGYTYLWDNGATTAQTTALDSGTHQVTITDANGCVQTFDVEVTAPEPLSSVLYWQDIDCYGDQNAQVALKVVRGGTRPYQSLKWFVVENGLLVEVTDTLQAANDSLRLLNLGVDTFVLEVIDAQMCTMLDTHITTGPDSIEIFAHSNQVCDLSSPDGSLVIDSVVGGTAPFTYLWETTQTTDSIGGLNVGWYTLTVTDDNGCIQVDSFEVDTTDLRANLQVDQSVSCLGGSDGIVSSVPSGGTMPYSYNWNSAGGQTGNTISLSGLSADTFYMTISDNGGCAFLDTIVLTEPSSAVDTSSTTVNHPQCADSLSGTVEVFATGGTPSYTYLWDNGATAAQTTALDSGTHQVTITDANGCVQTFDVEVTAPEPLSSVLYWQDIDCYGDQNAQVALKVVRGGTRPYQSLKWFVVENGLLVEVTDTLQAANDSLRLLNLGVDTFVLEVIDAQMCTMLDTHITTGPDSISVLDSIVDLNCISSSSGEVHLNVQGGTSPYTFNWSVPAASNSITGLTQGTYQVSVDDDNNCGPVVRSYTVGPPPTLVIDFDSTDVTCFGANDGTATAQVTGGMSTYTYLWSNAQTSVQATGLMPNLYYSVTVTDQATMCQGIDSVMVSQATLLVLDTNVTHVLCFSEATGAIQANISGGQAPYAFNWSVVGQTDSILDSLVAGTYAFTVTDDLGCQDSITSIVVNQPPILNALPFTIETNCFGASDGTMFVVPTGGTPGYDYNWSHDSTLNNAFANGLASGVYIVTISDTNDCTFSISAQVDNPDQITVNLTKDADEDCGLENGQASVSFSGGTGSLEALWLTDSTTNLTNTNLIGGAYQFIEVSDANGCVVRDSLMIDAVYNLNLSITVLPPAGFYCGNDSLDLWVSSNGSIDQILWSTAEQTDSIVLVPVSDTSVWVQISNARCMASDTIDLQVNPSPEIELQADSILCDGAQANFSVSSNLPASYQWSNGATSASTSVAMTDTTYSMFVTVTSNDGCSTVDQSTFVDVAVFESPTAQFDTLPRGLFLDEIKFSDSSYLDIVSWQWDFGDGFSSNLTSPTHIYESSDSFLVVLTVANSVGCIAADSMVIVVEESIYIPNVFSPNGDGYNDYFTIPTSGIGMYELVIRNRWGEVLFVSESSKIIWNGTSQSGSPVPEGTYYYILKAIGTQDYSRMGTVTLFRD